ncbi:nucleotide exchange factor GrpE [Leptospira sp. GIMC2001]|uniref:nucleotide exchange factor GrpE n=1 Tax=Leptospira sp. GIMC2001 TaxID=1513297 RepID=UPI00234AC4DC|nr:nucleotide exchange factor GrpE [Leptospira sp. GIMC2001]WCL49356.1 nucleotide exchange factor GrpE [Leptospira sp. GIMC2001]
MSEEMNTDTLETMESKNEEFTNGENLNGEGSAKGFSPENNSEVSANSEASNTEITREMELEEELKKARQEAESFKDSWQRERAEFTNYKRRTAGELMNSRKEAVKNFIHELLNPIDNLDRVTAVKTESQEFKAFIDGIAMVKKEFIGILDKEGVKKMEPVGEAFDPMLMEAIASEESDDYSEETVIEVFQPGYYSMDGDNKQSIRPARVKVGKPKA